MVSRDSSSFILHPSFLRTLFFLMTVSFLAACGGKPSGVPSKSRMRKILYDYHKAQAMVGTTNEGEYINSEKLLLSVLDKHGLDSEMFDSAMVWYCENPDQLQDIYKDLEKQLKAEDEELQAKVGSSEMTSIYSEGDTANIWTGAKLIVLRPHPLMCLEQFKLKADSSYHHNDHFILNADVKFIKEDRSAGTTLYLSMTIKTKDGMTYSQICEPRGSSIQRIDISQASEEDISEINGFFYYKAEGNTKSMCVINGISLIRMHVKEATDTTAIDSALTDTTELPAEGPRQNDDSPRIPSIELSDSAPTGSKAPKTPVNRRNEVQDIEIKKAPETKQQQPTQRRQSIQQGRQNQQPQRPRPQRPNNPQRR